MSEVPNRVRLCRQAHGLTQQELADRIGISQARVSQIESGRGRPPTHRLLVNFADALGVGVSALVGDDPAFDRVDSTETVAAGGVFADLPLATAPLIGRAEDIVAVNQLLSSDEVRLITLVGPGGVGKTHLALRAAMEAAHFEHVAVVPLASRTDASQVLSAIAHVVGIDDREVRSLRDRLVAKLASARWLLVLDTMAQALPSAASLVSDLRVACPHLTQLVTCRAPLKIRFECVVRIEPLSVPNRVTDVTVEAMAASPAVQLFLQRAQAASPAFRLTPENAPTVAEIVRRLDGLPLAIELAAERAKTFSPAALLRRLDNRLDFLEAESRDMPPRQRTLRAAIDWAHDLLDKEDQAVFCRLAVFSGGFTDEAAEAVGLSPIALHRGQPGDVLEHVGTLYDWSFLTRTTNQDGTHRFGMLHTIQEYSREKLALAGETAEVRRRHLAWCLDFAEQAMAKMYTSDEAAWLDRLEHEDANIQEALSWAFGPGAESDLEAGLGLAGALVDYWYMCGYMSEAHTWLSKGIDLCAGQQPSIGQARVLIGAGLIEQAQARDELAKKHCEQGLIQARMHDDRPTVGRAVLLLGNLALSAGQFDQARSLFQEALSTFRDLGVGAWATVTLLDLGLCYFRQGDLTRATQYVQEGLTLAQASGNRWDTITALRFQGDIEKASGDFKQARMQFIESLRLAWRYRSEREAADSLSGLGAVAEQAGDFVRAARFLSAAETLYQRFGINLPPPLRPDWVEIVERVKEGLGTERFAQVWGASPPDDVIREVIGHHRPGHQDGRALQRRPSRVPRIKPMRITRPHTRRRLAS